MGIEKTKNYNRDWIWDIVFKLPYKWLLNLIEILNDNLSSQNWIKFYYKL